ncbi:hypothetical protein Zm00014a_027263 [Zea mays]|uniref:Uncharacterized protein n=1 Tax=Zea mays TaxID=4577 RepID=A0A317Y8B6_MAIZE|nr:hypothetical protein Zm00014a_027263 [Zea mays]
MRRQRRTGGLRPLLLLLPFAALISVATFSLHSADRLLSSSDTGTAQKAASSSRQHRRLPVATLDVRALDAAPPLHAAAARASGPAAASSATSFLPSPSAPAPPPAGPGAARARPRSCGRARSSAALAAASCCPCHAG